MDKNEQHHQHQRQQQHQQQVNCSQHNDDQQLVIKILSATYGACEGQRLLTGELSNNAAARVPYSRDVTPFLRALLVAQSCREEDEDEDDEEKENSEKILDPQEAVAVRMNAITGEGGMKRTYIRLLHGRRNMNSFFGDPCPGTSKKLFVRYVVADATDNSVCRAASSEVYNVSFTEHEQVVFRRKLTLFQDDLHLKQAALARATILKHNHTNNNDTLINNDKDNNNNNSHDPANKEEAALAIARRMGRTQSIADFEQESLEKSSSQYSTSVVPARTEACSFENTSSSSNGEHQNQYNQQNNHLHKSSSSSEHNYRSKWRLRSAISEIVLPIALDFLEIHERVQCRLICIVWRNIVRDWGVATTIDSNDTTISKNFTLPYLRGILSHSYSSLCNLFLSGFHHLKQEDIHPSIPHLRKLRSLDISECINLDDTTLSLLSTHVQTTLEVLYIKGLRNVSDCGIISICKSCSRLKVLDLSYVPITDESLIAVGYNLLKLHALFLRDNYKITNHSLDFITKNCLRLEELTLWGCIRLKYLNFDNPGTGNGQPPQQPNNVNNASASLFASSSLSSCSTNLVSLNLWGCHGLRDEVANSFSNMRNLRSLIVSECHYLTDTFVTSIAQNIPQLIHLHLRYCKRITNIGVNAIANAMENIYSLDLSFCTQLTSAAISYLIETRYNTLAELRLQNCHKLDIGYDPHNNDNDNLRRDRQQFIGGGIAGCIILNAIRYNSTQNCLSLLDVRNCGGQPNINEDYNENDPFVLGMKSLTFEQKIPGFFIRRARWNVNVQRRLLNGALG